MNLYSFDNLVDNTPFMINKLYAITKNGLPVVSAAADVPADVPVKRYRALLYLSVAAIVVAAGGTVAAWGINAIIHTIASLVYYERNRYGLQGDRKYRTELVDHWYSGGGRAASCCHSPFIRRPLLRALGLSVAIGAGNPLGIENAAMLFNGGLGVWIGKLFGGTSDECRLLFRQACAVL